MTQHCESLQSLLINLKSDLHSGQKLLMVFDLDSTLFDVSPRIQKILEDLRDQDQIRKAFPELLPFLKDIRTQRTDWGIKSALTRAFEKASFPPSPDFQNAARDFWARHFFSNEYLHFDHPVEGAVDFVNELHQLKIDIAYLTGRDWERMGPGTLEVLKKWKFPELNDKSVLLAMKPQKGSDDSFFKSTWFESLKPHAYNRILFFDNEPKILHHVELQHPEIEIIFMETTHSGKAEPNKSWITIPHFLVR